MSLSRSAGHAPAMTRVVRRESVTSTNDVARCLAGEGADAWTVVLADRQTGGRGRAGRFWESPPGNLYSTLILRPGRPTVEWPSLSLVVALAIRDTVCRWLPADETRLKWPNDVMVGGRKVSGVLLETVPGQTPAILVGTGINVASCPDGAAALAALGTPAPTLAAVTETYLAAMSARVEAWEANGFAALREEWVASAAHRGETVLVRNGERVEEGRLVDLGGDGTLVIEDASGRPRRLAAGDLVATHGG